MDEDKISNARKIYGRTHSEFEQKIVIESPILQKDKQTPDWFKHGMLNIVNQTVCHCTKAESVVAVAAAVIWKSVYAKLKRAKR